MSKEPQEIDTDEIDIQIAKLRFQGLGPDAIGERIGRAGSTVWRRLQPPSPAAAILQRLLDAEVETARQQARRHTAAAIRTLAEIQADPSAPHAARIAAARELLARGGVVEASEVRQTVEATVTVDARSAIREAVAELPDAALGITADDD